MKRNFSPRKLALLSVFCGLALLMFIVESLFPSIILPGAKMGLSNIFTLLTVVLLGGGEAVILVVARTVLGCLIVGNIGALIYSLSAGLVSVFVTIILYRYVYPKISLVAISVTSAVVHNIVQTLVFVLVTNTWGFVSFLGYLALYGLVAGLVVGFAVILLLRWTPKSFFEKMEL